MSVKSHYDNHLGKFYSWMVGDFQLKQLEMQSFFKSVGVSTAVGAYGVDLGAGNGIQSFALGSLGFEVTAIDFNNQLLEELKNNCRKLEVEALNGDIRDFRNLISRNPSVITCWGDTLTHLGNSGEVETLIRDAGEMLNEGGQLVLSFRDYTRPLTGDSRFIPVKNDESKILTCFLEYQTDIVKVTDLLHEYVDGEWVQKVSSYEKLIVSPEMVEQSIFSNNMEVVFKETEMGLCKLCARKGK